MLYTLYSFPNIVLPFFGGKLVDRVGSAVCLSIFASLCLLGQIVLATGVTYQNWMIMFLGRALYGFGGESICVAYSTLLSEWFAGKEIALSFGIALAVARLGSVINNLWSPVLANEISTPSAFWMGVLANSISATVAISIRWLDGKNQRAPHSLIQDTLREPLLQDSTTAESQNERPGSSRPQLASPFGILFWLLSLSCLFVYACVLPWNNVASGILLERDYFRATPPECRLMYPDQCTAGFLQNHSNPSLDSEGKPCPGGSSYAPVLPTSLTVEYDEKHCYTNQTIKLSDVDCNDQFWAHGCTKDYCDALHKAELRASRVMSIPYTISAFLSPFLGRAVDKIGLRACGCLFAAFLLAFVHAILALTGAEPILPLIGQGLAYSLYSSVLWPSVTLTVPKDFTGTAFGLITSIQNAGLALFPLVVAAIYNHSNNSYMPNVEYFFTACASFGIAVGIFLNLADLKKGNVLNSIENKENTYMGHRE